MKKINIRHKWNFVCRMKLNHEIYDQIDQASILHMQLVGKIRGQLYDELRRQLGIPA